MIIYILRINNNNDQWSYHVIGWYRDAGGKHTLKEVKGSEVIT